MIIVMSHYDMITVMSHITIIITRCDITMITSHCGISMIISLYDITIIMLQQLSSNPAHLVNLICYAICNNISAITLSW